MLTRRHLMGGIAAVAAVANSRAGTAAALAAGVKPPVMAQNYLPVGVGGGGGFLGFSMSPYQDLWFVGTDMGTLFRSIDLGVSWQSVPSRNAVFLDRLNGQDYPDLPGPGYSATSNVVFHAPATGSPIVSTDGGITWTTMALGGATQRVRFWYPDSSNPGRVFAGLDDGMAVTDDDGGSWRYIAAGMGRARGCFLDRGGSVLYTAFANGIFVSPDRGKSFTRVVAAADLHRFAGGRGKDGAVFTYVSGAAAGGAVFIGGPSGMAPAQVSVGGELLPLTGAEHVQMAENDSVVYVAGARSLPNQDGTQVWRSTGGGPFLLIFKQADKGYGVDPWPTLQPSAVGLDIGYWDGGYFSFAVNQQNADMVGGGELYFLHVSRDGGQTWLSPFTAPVSDPAGPGQAWTSTGLENVSIRKVKFSGVDPKFGVACGCDCSVLLTEDGGRSWRVATSMGYWKRLRLPHQSCYDVVFDPAHPDTVYAALSDIHDFQHSGNFGRTLPGSGKGGGIYKSSDRGRSWTQFTDGSAAASMPFVSIAYNEADELLYAGSQGGGLATMTLSGGDWTWRNAGFLDPNAIVAQIEADPATGDMYALLGSDPSDPKGYWPRSGLYRLPRGEMSWQHLRGTPQCPAWTLRLESFMLYPTSFALERDRAGQVISYLVTDAELCGNYLGTGLWRSTDNGVTWTRLQQYTFAYAVNLDPNDPDRIYLSGDTAWGAGGAMFSADGGATFKVNTALEVQKSIWSVTPDPNNEGQIFYTCFGAGMRHGPRP